DLCYVERAVVSRAQRSASSKVRSRASFDALCERCAADPGPRFGRRNRGPGSALARQRALAWPGHEEDAAMPGISIHVVDVSRGVLAAGMRVALHRILDAGKLDLITNGRIASNGLLEQPELAQTFAAGGYAAVFQVGDYYRLTGVALPAVPFLDVVHFRFG